MCGITGWISDDERGIPPSVLESMVHAIAHRGPDGKGQFITPDLQNGPQVALGHCRLAIIDLEGGHQPMLRPDGAAIIFNGEISNHRELRRELEKLGCQFTTHSDTEVLLHGIATFGNDFIERLEGMFAFAYWDPTRQRLLLGRDRYGKKPLFLARIGQTVFFASEIKSLLRVPGLEGRIDLDSLGLYFAFRYVPGPGTLIAGMTKLPAGHLATWQKGSFTARRYYDLPDALPLAEPDPIVDPRPAFLERLEVAVRKRLIADVPLGAFLSGGIDSSLIVALMTRLGAEPVETFSIGYRERAFSELGYAHRVAQHLGCRHHEALFSADRIADLLPMATRHRDAPVSEPADLPIWELSRLASNSVKVVLTGEGSDEIFAGYPKHAYEQWGEWYRRMVPCALDGLVVAPIARRLPFGLSRVATLVHSIVMRDFSDRMARWFGGFSRAEQNAITTVRRPDYHVPGDRPDNGALRRILHFDQAVWLPDNLLERGDRMTMAHGLEARMPFLDHELANFVSKLPDCWRLNGLSGKRIVREVAQEFLPIEIINRPKSGFRMPVSRWFRDEMRDFAWDSLTGPYALSKPFYRPGKVENILSDHASGRTNYEKTIWMMLALEVFQKEYLLTMPND